MAKHVQKLVEFLVSKGMSEAGVAALPPEALAATAKALGFVAPPVTLDYWNGLDKDGKKSGKPGYFLNIDVGGGFRSNGRVRVSEGETMTKEGREKAIAILTRVADGAADLLAEISAE